MGLKVTVAQFKRWLLRAFKTTVDLHMIQELKGGLVLGYGYIGRIIGFNRRIQAGSHPNLQGVFGTPIDFIISGPGQDRKSTRLNSSHVAISYAVFCLKKQTNNKSTMTTQPT